MNILVLGSGGREYILAWKIGQSKKVNNLYIAPGNGGTSDLGTNVDLDWRDIDHLTRFLERNKIDLLVIGPEAPLVEGLTDQLQKTTSLASLLIIGPNKAAAQLEGSKAFAKAFMEKQGIPTANYQTFNREELNLAKKYIQSQKAPYVLKADGLAAGKGVLILHDSEEAMKEAEAMLEGKFGEAGHTLVIESFLEGLEFSVFALCSGTDYLLLPVAKDYKRIGEGDSGLNTGGMGAVSPVPGITDSILQKVEAQIIKPTLTGMREAGTPFSGFLFFGLILVEGEPFVIEYNVRLGDPETQVVLPRIESDFVDLLIATAEGNLQEKNINISKEAAVCTVLASEGYPLKYEKGMRIRLPNEKSESVLFAHAGTKRENNHLLTAGGRVMGCIGLHKNLKTAKLKSQNGAAQVQFKGKYFRSDIGSDLGVL